MMKKLLFALSFLAFQNYNAQLVVDSSLPPGQIVENVFLANGIFISNLTYNGLNSASPSVSVGTFSETNTGLGISSGLLMSTGTAAEAIGPNDGLVNGSADPTAILNDPDLQLLLNSASYTYDGAIIEFDFIATGDSLDFVYVFGSEEYEEFVNSSFNDVFGFFVSGPGITGPFSNGATNIALVPGTGDFVSINNVNSGLNSAYYVYNAAMDLEYDGFTVPMHASIGGLAVGETYHIKLAITDTSDGILDSGVFLSGSSFVQACSPQGPRECLICQIHANVQYTENCGEVILHNISEVNLATTGCHYDMGDGNQVSSCDGDVTYNFASPGTYEVKLTYLLNEFHSTYVVGNIVVSDTPPVQPQISQAGNILSVNNWDGESYLQWYFNDQPIAGANGSQYTPLESGSYYVEAINGCLSRSADFNAVVSSVGELTQQKNRVYPNPSSGLINMELSNEAATIQVIDALGRIVEQLNVKNNNRVQLNLQQGVYSIQTMDVKGQSIEVNRVVIR